MLTEEQEKKGKRTAGWTEGWINISKLLFYSFFVGWIFLKVILGTNFSRPRSFDFSICSCFKNIIENNRLPSGLFSFFQRRVTGWKGLKESSTEGLKSLSGGLGGEQAAALLAQICCLEEVGKRVEQTTDFPQRSAHTFLHLFCTEGRVSRLCCK